MKVSIITPTFNSEKTIRDTLNSVNRQSYHNLEQIIIDGGSTDNTLHIVRTAGKMVGKIVSEPDNGIFDAMNKGIALSKGEVIGILNSDDIYNHRNVIKEVVRVLKTKKVDCVWGDAVYTSPKNLQKVLLYWKSSNYRPGIFQKGWVPPHPTFFAKKLLYQHYGNFRAENIFAGDYELLLRFLEKNKVSGSYLPQLLVRMRLGGKGKSLFARFHSNMERWHAWQENDLKGNPLLILGSKPFWYIYFFLLHFKYDKKI